MGRTRGETIGTRLVFLSILSGEGTVCAPRASSQALKNGQKLMLLSVFITTDLTGYSEHAQCLQVLTG